MKQQLESFQYNKAINDANELLENKVKINDKDLIEIYRIKAIAQYSLQNEKGAKESFFNILKIDTTFTLDPSTTSPKIIAFFDQVKNDYLQVFESEKQIVKTKTDTVYIPKIVHSEQSTSELKQAAIRSVILPGWGHLYMGDNLKGTILTSLSLITLGSSIYFIIDSNKKERLYLDALDPSLIQQRYNDYNKSYKLKNISLVSFAAVWLYSQIDLLFFSGKNPLNISNVEFLHSNQTQLNFQIKF
ncbi:MAG: hypothetical protein M1480_21400 [Bacteroidetes bacterium]|nr:hypothetical protein [Bacteroidota bacterium]